MLLSLSSRSVSARCSRSPRAAAPRAPIAWPNSAVLLRTIRRTGRGRFAAWTATPRVTRIQPSPSAASRSAHASTSPTRRYPIAPRGGSSLSTCGTSNPPVPVTTRASRRSAIKCGRCFPSPRPITTGARPMAGKLPSSSPCRSVDAELPQTREDPAHAPRLRVRQRNARRRRRGTNRLPAGTQPVTVTRRQSRAMKLTPSLTFGVVYSVPQHSPLDAWSCTVTGSANGRATGGKLP